MTHLKNILKMTRGKTKLFTRREDGTTAIEFAILALPFFTLLFGIIELAIIFFIQSNVQNAAFEAARQVRTGEFRGTENQLKNQICRQMNPKATQNSDADVENCRQRMDVKLSPLGNFSSATSFAPNQTAPTGTPPPNVVLANGGDTMLMSVDYRYFLAIPGDVSRLKNSDGVKQINPAQPTSPRTDNYRTISVVTAFRNEPF